MRASANGLRLVQLFESLGDGNRKTADFEPYICPAHIYTVGWGHILYTPDNHRIDVDTYGSAKAAELAHAAMQKKFGKQAITKEEADNLLDSDMMGFEQGVEKQIGLGNATQGQFDAMTAFAYNVGLGNFGISALKRLHIANQRTIGQIDLVALIAKARAKANPNTMPLAFLRWCTGNGAFMLGLFRRRIAEMLVYSGWQADKAYALVMAFRG